MAVEALLLCASKTQCTASSAVSSPLALLTLSSRSPSAGTDSTGGVSKQSVLARMLLISTVILWDEALMAHKLAFEAVDRLLRDLTSVDLLFGGKIFTVGGNKASNSSCRPSRR